MIAKSGPTGIPARTEGTPGKAEVTTYKFDGTNLVETGRVMAFNLASGPIQPNAWLMLKDNDGHLFAIFEDCVGYC